jgi:hypothetical protein
MVVDLRADAGKCLLAEANWSRFETLPFAALDRELDSDSFRAALQAPARRAAAANDRLPCPPSSR